MNLTKLFHRFPVLETERLVLREMMPEDSAAVLDIFSDDEVTRYYDIATMTGIEEAEYFIGACSDLYHRRVGIRWGITRKGENRVLGSCGFPFFTDRADQGEIGYELGRAHWRDGIMSEALGAVLRYGFEEIGLNRVQALVRPGNFGSAGLLVRLGFRDEGVLRESVFYKKAYHDHHCFALLRGEWEGEEVGEV